MKRLSFDPQQILVYLLFCLVYHGLYVPYFGQIMEFVMQDEIMKNFGEQEEEK